MQSKSEIGQCLILREGQFILRRSLTIVIVFGLCLSAPLLGAEPRSAEEQDNNVELSVESDLSTNTDTLQPQVNEVTQKNDQRVAAFGAMERFESYLQALKEGLEQTTKQLSFVEKRLIDSTAKKEIEINRLNAALAAMIVEGESVEKARIDLESRLQKLQVEKQEIVARLNDSLTAERAKNQSLQAETEAIISENKRALTEKNAEIARLRADLSELKLVVTRLEDENQQRTAEVESVSDKLQNVTQKLEVSMSDFGALEQALNQTQVDLGM